VGKQDERGTHEIVETKSAVRGGERRRADRGRAGRGQRVGRDSRARFGGDNDEGPGAPVVILVSGVVYAVSFVLLQALSRYREFAADRGSAIITGRPSALISALLKISGNMQQIPQRDLRAASGELAAFYIFPPKAKQAVSTLFATHPPLEKRIAALERLEAQLQGTSR